MAPRAIRGHVERSRDGIRRLKNLIMFEKCCVLNDFEQQIAAFICHYKNQSYQESLRNVTPTDAHYGRVPKILSRDNK